MITSEDRNAMIRKLITRQQQRIDDLWESLKRENDRMEEYKNFLKSNGGEQNG